MSFRNKKNPPCSPFLCTISPEYGFYFLENTKINQKGEENKKKNCW